MHSSIVKHRANIKEGGGPSDYVEDMIQSIQKMNSWVQESQKRYNKEMEEARERQGFKKHVLTYRVGVRSGLGEEGRMGQQDRGQRCIGK